MVIAQADADGAMVHVFVAGRQLECLRKAVGGEALFGAHGGRLRLRDSSLGTWAEEQTGMSRTALYLLPWSHLVLGQRAREGIIQDLP